LFSRYPLFLSVLYIHSLGLYHYNLVSLFLDLLFSFTKSPQLLKPGIILSIGFLRLHIIYITGKGAIERKEEKIASLDEDLLKELAADELLKKERQEQKEAKKQKKAGEKIRQRIAAEKRAKATFTETLEEEDDDVGDYTTFAKGGRSSMVKKC